MPPSVLTLVNWRGILKPGKGANGIVITCNARMTSEVFPSQVFSMPQTHGTSLRFTHNNRTLEQQG